MVKSYIPPYIPIDKQNLPPKDGYADDLLAYIERKETKIESGMIRQHTRARIAVPEDWDSIF
jgi:hypothetical protein